MARPAVELVPDEAVDRVALEVDGRLHAGDVIDIRLVSAAAHVIRLDPQRHSNRGLVKLSLLDLPLRRGQLQDLVPE